MVAALDVLKKYWNHSSFRLPQEAIIQAVLQGEDVLALLPTGGGKSLCFQIPALLKDGLCLVISPLIALMKDQVANLANKGIPALLIHSGMTFYEVKKTLQDAAYGDFKFLYLSPERLETNLFKEYLPAIPVNLIAVDEAHCISQWGYDFRPPYLRIANLREELPDIPVVALTASATPLVQEDIMEKLLFENKNVFRQSFERGNISYSAFKVDSKINKAIEILNNVSGSGIVYCRSRKLTKEVANLLQMQNISADYYHAGLSAQERNTKQQQWINNETRVIVCTNAFGMGIDKPDVRTVVHYDVPECLENYYQEAGRAGRDGNKAYAVLLYNHEDEENLKKLPEVKFPAIQQVKKIYQALADYLQIPVGLGEGNYYDFNLNEFVKNFGVDAILVINTLKVLEQEGHLTFNENIFLPSQATFSCDKETLYNFETAHPLLEPLIKCLLRTYQGIFDNDVSIHEKQIARLIRIEEDVVRQQLQQLHAFGIIEYRIQKETPQIHFLLNRAPADYLHINHNEYFKRKEQYALRVDVMVNYLTLTKKCRSAYIASYFGDMELKDCGVCDNCLQQKNSVISTQEFASISKKILDVVQENRLQVKELLQHLKGINKEKLWRVLQHLESEKKLKVDGAGFIQRL